MCVRACASDSVSAYGASVASLPFRGETPVDVPEHGTVCVGLLVSVCTYLWRWSLTRAGWLKRHFLAFNFLIESRMSLPRNVRNGRGSSNARLVLVGAGPPCQKDCSHTSRSTQQNDGDAPTSPRSPHTLVQPVVAMLREAFPWAQVHFLQESVFGLGPHDRAIYTAQAGVLPYLISASEISPCRRDRLYWFDWRLAGTGQILLYPPSDTSPSFYGEVKFNIELDAKGILEPGWKFFDGVKKFHTFTSA